MFSIFKRKPDIIATSFSFLQTDMHAHILPGIDDGAKNMEESIALINCMHKLGYQKIIATPHISIDIYPNKRQQIEEIFKNVQLAVLEAKIPMEIGVAAEYMIDEHLMELISAQKPLLTLSDNYVLVEMGYIQESPLLWDALFQLQSSGYRPVLAHPERYKYYHNNVLAQAKRLKEKGFHLQLNVLALSGHYGKTVQHAAVQLLKAGLYDFCGSDIHHMAHIDTMFQMKTLTNYPLLQKFKFMNNLM